MNFIQTSENFTKIRQFHQKFTSKSDFHVKFSIQGGFQVILGENREKFRLIGKILSIIATLCT